MIKSRRSCSQSGKAFSHCTSGGAERRDRPVCYPAGCLAARGLSHVLLLGLLVIANTLFAAETVIPTEDTLVRLEWPKDFVRLRSFAAQSGKPGEIVPDPAPAEGPGRMGRKGIVYCGFLLRENDKAIEIEELFSRNHRVLWKVACDKYQFDPEGRLQVVGQRRGLWSLAGWPRDTLAVAAARGGIQGLHVAGDDVEWTETPTISRATGPEIDDSLFELGFTVGEVIAARLRHLIPSEATRGKIAKVDESLVHTTLGSKQGVSEGQELLVFRGNEDLKDPTTGDILGKARNQVARIEVVDSRPDFSIAKRTGAANGDLNVGDDVEPAIRVNAVAVLPFVENRASSALAGGVAEELIKLLAQNNLDGGKLGLQLAAEVTTVLTRHNVRVVERGLLDKVAINELNRQQDGAFDRERVRRLGKQVGATFLVCGTTAVQMLGSKAGGKAEATIHLRLFKVETGDVVYALRWTALLDDTRLGLDRPLSRAGR